MEFGLFFLIFNFCLGTDMHTQGTFQQFRISQQQFHGHDMSDIFSFRFFFFVPFDFGFKCVVSCLIHFTSLHFWILFAIPIVTFWLMNSQHTSTDEWTKNIHKLKTFSKFKNNDSNNNKKNHGTWSFLRFAFFALTTTPYVHSNKLMCSFVLFGRLDHSLNVRNRILYTANEKHRQQQQPQKPASIAAQKKWMTMLYAHSIFGCV